MTGEIDPEVMAIVAELDSYTEISPSGTGLRVFTEGEIEEDGRKDEDAGVEVYCAGRYLTLTGHHLPGTPKTVNPRQAQIDAVKARISRNHSSPRNRRRSRRKVVRRPRSISTLAPNRPSGCPRRQWPCGAVSGAR